MASQQEFWLRGPVEGIPFLLQPVAHALLQAEAEVEELMRDFPDALLWERPAGLASPAFHLQHLPGVIDRLFTYAKGDLLSDEQKASLSAEGKEAAGITGKELVRKFGEQVQKALAQLRQTDERTLTEVRGVGRAQIPSTVIGLMTHAAEHTMRHVGQLLVTTRVLREEKK